MLAEGLSKPLVLDVEKPEWSTPLLRPSRFKAIRGGRGGGKSHERAEEVVLRCMGPNKLDVSGERRPVRIVCIREVQNSIKESVRQLIIDKINKLGVADRFQVLDAEIRGPHDSLIIFKGMQAHNAANIKSLEGFDVAWVEEAQTFSQYSLDLLIPTLRKEYADGTMSELWFTWNTRFETDPVDHFFFGNSPEAKGWARPTDAIIVECQWYDNPWLNKALIQSKDDMYASDPEKAENVWGGGYERITAGAYYAKQISTLERKGRIGRFPYDPELGPVYTSWDLGVDDYTAIWFYQIHHVDGEPRVRVLDYFEFTGFGAEDIVRSAMPEYTPDIQERIAAYDEIGRDVGYKYQRHFLPHDIGNREWGGGAKERIVVMNQLGIPLHSMHRGVATNPENRIEASRQLLPMCEFNNSSRVMIGLSRLRRYQKKFNTKLGIYMGPDHDSNSHAADSFGEFAINCGVKMPEPEREAPKPASHAEAAKLRYPVRRDNKKGSIRV